MIFIHAFLKKRKEKKRKKYEVLLFYNSYLNIPFDNFIIYFNFELEILAQIKSTEFVYNKSLKHYILVS